MNGVALREELQKAKKVLDAWVVKRQQWGTYFLNSPKNESWL